MAEISPIAKDRANQSQGYKFRGIDDVYQAVQAIMAKHGVFTTSEIVWDRTEERTTSKGSALIYRVLLIRWRFFAVDGSSVTTETIGEGMDSGDKASNKAMSVAHKYAFLQIYCIPTHDPKDPENESQELKPKPPVQPQRPAPSPQRQAYQGPPGRAPQPSRVVPPRDDDIPFGR